jgi:hypothetical protein
MKKIDDKISCVKCRKRIMTERGLIKTGCINPAVVVCPDREPAVIESLFNTETNLHIGTVRDVLDGAICYIGHEACRKHMEDQRKILQAGEDESSCPFCGLKLKIVTGKGSVEGICRLHGVIWHGILKFARQNWK